MKAAIITEEQIKAIEHVLFHGNDAFDYQHEEALAIVQSLKVQEPVAWADWSMDGVQYSEIETTYGEPLYAGEQP